eukprot:2883348-Prorocentrum_lima.AAC.1
MFGELALGGGEGRRAKIGVRHRPWQSHGRHIWRIGRRIPVCSGPFRVVPVRPLAVLGSAAAPLLRGARSRP